MTSLAMIAGMVPMALGLGEGGEQTAPLGRAVIGGLVASTVATLLVLPSVFAVFMAGAGRESASLDPFDPESNHFVREARDAHLALAVGAAGDRAPESARRGRRRCGPGGRRASRLNRNPKVESVGPFVSVERRPNRPKSATGHDPARKAGF